MRKTLSLLLIFAAVAYVSAQGGREENSEIISQPEVTAVKAEDLRMQVGSGPRGIPVKTEEMIVQPDMSVLNVVGTLALCGGLFYWARSLGPMPNPPKFL